MADDRPDIPTDLVRTLIADQFPQWAHLSITPVIPGGWDNRTFHLGDTMSIRMPSASRYAAQVEKEHRFLPALAAHLPFAISRPLATGHPGHGYPWPFGIYAWLDGEPANHARVPDLDGFAGDVASFLNALRAIDAGDGPQAGEHNFHRGGPLSIYETEARETLAKLSDIVDAGLIGEILDLALSTCWEEPAVWVHGDIAWGNLLVRDGRLSAVIDFGSSGTGDPACDLAIAWTFLDGASRKVFRSALALDDATWQRGRGWALWKALIVLAQHRESDPATAAEQMRVIDAVAQDYKEAA